MDIIQFIKKYYIDPIYKQQKAVGVEIELPLVSVKKAPIELCFVKKLDKYFKTIGFTSTGYTLDGYAWKWEDIEGDICTFETSLNTLEFSMKYHQSLTVIAKRFYKILKGLQKFCLDNDYYICGLGINPNYANLNTAPLNIPILKAKAEFLELYTDHHDGELFHSICASVQTHLNATNLNDYLKYFNLLRKAYVFDALYFANSLPPNELFLAEKAALKNADSDTLCFRDELWKLCGAPNVVAKDTESSSEAELCRYLSELKLFIIPNGDGFKPMLPISVKDYFNKNENAELAMSCFRSLEPVAPTQNGTLELRSTCTQPLDSLFAPSAFYIGLCENSESANKYIDEIYSEFFSLKSPYEVRTMLMKKSNTALRKQLTEAGKGLIEISVAGLKQRSFGEEVFLSELLTAKEFTPPALRKTVNSKDETIRQMKNIEEICL